MILHQVQDSGSHSPEILAFSNRENKPKNNLFFRNFLFNYLKSKKEEAI